jgi:hypothetical protein
MESRFVILHDRIKIRIVELYVSRKYKFRFKKICNSTPYYAQANGQAESTYKIIKNNIRKVVDNNPTCWDELFSEVLWAYRTSKRLSINTTPYSLVYGHDAVIPIEITVKSLRVARQNQLSHVDYESAMLAELDDIDEQQIAALNSIMI